MYISLWFYFIFAFITYMFFFITGREKIICLLLFQLFFVFVFFSKYLINISITRHIYTGEKTFIKFELYNIKESKRRKIVFLDSHAVPKGNKFYYFSNLKYNKKICLLFISSLKCI